MYQPKHKKQRQEQEATSRKRLWLWIPAGVCGALLAVVLVLYGLALTGWSEFVNTYRDLWIETAMTTTNHRWLATAFFPEEMIKEVMGEKAPDDGSVSVIPDTEPVPEEPEPAPDILGQQGLKPGDLDYAGFEILYNDIEQGVLISRITGEGFEGKVALIDDPSRLFLETTAYKGDKGEKILTYLEKYDAILGINASPYENPKWRGTGGHILGKTLSANQGAWGKYLKKYNTIGFDQNHRLVIGKLKESEWETYGLRDAMQFSPSLIVNGKQKVFGSGGWGIQPRTIVGQREDGVVALLQVDGRRPGYSIGAKLGDCAEILLKYGVINAAACDGGSSSVMAYNGELISIPTTIKDGRTLPNVWLVKRK